MDPVVEALIAILSRRGTEDFPASDKERRDWRPPQGYYMDEGRKPLFSTPVVGMGRGLEGGVDVSPPTPNLRAKPPKIWM